MIQLTRLHRAIAGVELYVATDDPEQVAKVKAKLDTIVKAATAPKPAATRPEAPSWMREFFGKAR